MNQNEKNVKRLIEIRDLAVESNDDTVTEKEILDLSHEAIQIAEKAEIIDKKKESVLRQLLNHEIKSYKKLIQSDMTIEARIDNLIFFCVSVTTLIHGKLDI